MKAAELEKFLNEEFNGKYFEYDNYELGKVAIKYLSEHGLNCDRVTAERRKGYPNNIYLSIIGPNGIGEHCFVVIETKKKRSDCVNHSWYAHPIYDWYYNGIKVSCFDCETIEASYNKAFEDMKHGLDKLNAKVDIAREIFEFLKTKVSNGVEAAELVKLASDKRYTLIDEVFKEKD